MGIGVHVYISVLVRKSILCMHVFYTWGFICVGMFLYFRSVACLRANACMLRICACMDSPGH